MKLLRESPVEFLEPLSRPPERVYAAEMETPFGPLVLVGDGEALLRVRIRIPLPQVIHELERDWNTDIRVDEASFRPVIKRLRAYFSGDTAPIRAVVRPLRISSFQLDIHRVLPRVPFGRTISYGELAMLAGHPGAFRAAGKACGGNHALIIVPCHRVVAVRGLGGFGAGLDMKEMLLRHEGALAGKTQ